MRNNRRIRESRNVRNKVSGALIIVTIAALSFVAGCSEDADPVRDNAPPFPPDGVFSVTGDGLVTIYWNDNWEDDLAGYDLYRNTQATGTYTRIGTVGKNTTQYDDLDVVNGETWFYAVLAFDRSGNESQLSYEDIFDTPRPEGFDLVLFDYLGPSSAQSGYNFAGLSNAAQVFDVSSPGTETNIYFDSSGGVNRLVSRPGSDIQDYGLIDLVSVDWGPSTGWAPSGSAEAIIGHSYIIRVVNASSEFNWAKIYVSDVSSTSVTLDWAYQEVVDNPELAPGPGRGAMP